MKRILYILAILPLFNSCLLEYPETTPDGEPGVDPTSVTLRTSITADFRMEGEETEYSHATIEYRHRITVAAYLDRQLAAKETIYEDLSENGIIRTNVSLDLHAREYRIVVWTDLVAEGSSDPAVAVPDPYYDITDLTSIRCNSSYRGQTVYKDALYASESIDLTAYKDEWGAKETMDISLSRPMGKYEIAATDVEQFLAKHVPSQDNRYEVKINYNGYIPTGFNALDGITRHSYNYCTYSRSISGISADAKEFAMAFDYIFMDKEEETVPVTLEIRDSRQEVIAKSNNIDIKIGKNRKNVVKGNFLTSMPGDGIGIDTEFDKKDDIDLGVI